MLLTENVKGETIFIPRTQIVSSDHPFEFKH